MANNRKGDLISQWCLGWPANADFSKTTWMSSWKLMRSKMMAMAATACATEVPRVRVRRTDVLHCQPKAAADPADLRHQLLQALFNSAKMLILPAHEVTWSPWWPAAWRPCGLCGSWFHQHRQEPDLWSDLILLCRPSRHRTSGGWRTPGSTFGWVPKAHPTTPNGRRGWQAEGGAAGWLEPSPGRSSRSISWASTLRRGWPLPESPLCPPKICRENFTSTQVIRMNSSLQLRILGFHGAAVCQWFNAPGGLDKVKNFLYEDCDMFTCPWVVMSTASPIYRIICNQWHDMEHTLNSVVHVAFFVEGLDPKWHRNDLLPVWLGWEIEQSMGGFTWVVSHLHKLRMSDAARTAFKGSRSLQQDC